MTEFQEKFKGLKADGLVKSLFSSPLAGGNEGEGEEILVNPSPISSPDDQGFVIPVGHHLVAHGGSAVHTGIIVFFPVGQYKQQSLAHRNRLPAVRTEKLRRVEILVLLPFHDINLHPE
jgi:hypothetical protein